MGEVGEAVLCGRAKAERTADRERLAKGETLNAGSGKLKTGQRRKVLSRPLFFCSAKVLKLCEVKPRDP